ncbi:electron carrier [Aspergillus fumigatus]|nr:electron carrier [Aspergillus fumigatus]KAH1540940.1 electron carrier [Aspergillus fumigatus]KAH1971859.1 electron carrier [Aspergillus fumigatus]KAH2301674.1 electron carrier [Aspergillus fumigatus]KAH2651589.1 electron carrier [Aspergillus fumigatus]
MAKQTLLLSPPSLSSQPGKLNETLQSYNRNATDLQMLDRLALGLASLPDSAYSSIVILAGGDNSFSESLKLINRQIFNQIIGSLRRGGYIYGQDAVSGIAFDHNEAILAGLIHVGNGKYQKPDIKEMQAVPLRLGRKNDHLAGAPSLQESAAEHPCPPEVSEGKTASVDDGVAAVGSQKSPETMISASTMNSNEASDDELINEDNLLDDSELSAPIIQPPECRPKAGKRRRACKDCTCGLAQKLQEEDAVKRADADEQLDAMRLLHDDLAEVDFTVQGKVGSCGNCSLGDAFRCEGCPFIGLPAFQPGEEVRLLNNDVQL